MAAAGLRGAARRPSATVPACAAAPACARIEHRALRADRAVGDEPVVAAEGGHRQLQSSAGCHDPPVPTAVISDLHLGRAQRRRRAAPPGRARAADRGARRCRPAGAAGRHARVARAAGRGSAGAGAGRCSRRLAPTLAGKSVTLVPGNHDHQLGQPWLARAQLAGPAARPENEWRGHRRRDRRPGRGAGVVAPAQRSHAGVPGSATGGRHLRHPRPLPRPAPDRAARRVDRGLGRRAARRPHRRLHERRRLRGRGGPDLRIPRGHGRGRQRRGARSRRDRVALGLETGDRRRASRPAAGRAGDDPGRGGRAQPPQDRPVQRDAERRGAAPRRAAGDGPGGGDAGPRRRARRCSATPTGPARCPATTGPSGARCPASASGTAATGTSSRRSSAAWPRTAPTGPGRSCGWSRAGRRGSRTRCAATRRRAPARRPGCRGRRRPRRTRACAGGTAR